MSIDLFRVSCESHILITGDAGSGISHLSEQNII